MSIFGKIKDAIFGHKGHESRKPPRRFPRAWTAARPPAPPRLGDHRRHRRRHRRRCRADARPRSLREKGKPDLNYSTSIVDLMKLLGIDSSLDNRKELATELGYTGDKDGSAEMNIWLHKRSDAPACRQRAARPPRA